MEPGVAAVAYATLFLLSAFMGPVGGVLVICGAFAGGWWGLVAGAVGSIILGVLASIFISLKKALEREPGPFSDVE